MKEALQTLKNQGIQISEEEELGVTLAILLHDIGHGPFSHALENSFVKDINHESISELFMHQLNDEFNGQLEVALSILRTNIQRNFCTD